MNRYVGGIIACVLCLGPILKADMVQYYLAADDYGDLYIDGTLVAHYDDDVEGGDWTDVLDLSPGWHDIAIVFENRWGSSSTALIEGTQGGDYDYVVLDKMRSLNAAGDWVDGLRADYYKPDDDYITTAYGEGPIHHVSGRYYEDVYNPDWASLGVPWGPSWWNLFEERLSGEIYVGSVVPLPGAALLGFLGLGAAGMKLRRSV